MPVRFMPISPGTDPSAAYNQINKNFAQLDHESLTKTFKQPGGHSIIQGRLPYDGGYGTLYYDADNVDRIVIGIDPDGNLNIHVSKEGTSITSLF